MTISDYTDEYEDSFKDFPWHSIRQSTPVACSPIGQSGNISTYYKLFGKKQH